MTGATKNLTPEQKERIAEIRKVGESRIAQAQIMLDEKMKQVAGRPDFAEQIEQERREFLEEKERIERDTERDVEAIKNR